MNVASLFATLGIKIDKHSFAAAEGALKRMHANLRRDKQFNPVIGANRASINAAYGEAKLEEIRRKEADKQRRARVWQNNQIIREDLRFARHMKAEQAAQLKQVKDSLWLQRLRARSDADAMKGSIGARIRRANDKVSQGLHGLSSHIIRGFAVGYIATGAIQTIADLGDEYNTAANRVKLLTQNTEQQKRIQDALFQSAQKTGVSFGAVTDLYQQLGKAAIDNGMSLEKAVTLTETVNMAVKASGPNADSARGALIQLAQVFAGNKFQAQEFNSIVKALPFLIDILAKNMNKKRGEIRKMVVDGEVTGKDLIDALVAQRPYVEDMYNKRIPLLGDAFTRLRNTASKAFGELLQDEKVANKLTNTLLLLETITKNIIDVFGWLVKHGTGVLVFLAALTSAFIALRVAALAAWVAEMLAAGPVGWGALAAGAVAGGLSMGGMMALAFGNNDKQAPTLSPEQINAVTGGAMTTTKNVTTGPVSFNISSSRASAEEIAAQVAEKFDAHLINAAAVV